VVVDDPGQLLDGIVEGLAVGVLELEHREHRLVALGVLVLTVLGLVLVDRVLVLESGDRHASPRRRRARCAAWPAPAYGVPVGRTVPQVAEQRLEAAVVVEDQVDHVTPPGPAEVDRRLTHGRWYPAFGAPTGPTVTGMTGERSARAALVLVVGLTRGAERDLSWVLSPSAVAVRLPARGDGARAHLADGAGGPMALYRLAQGTIGAVIGAVVTADSAGADRPRDAADRAGPGATLLLPVLAGRLLALALGRVGRDRGLLADRRWRLGRRGGGP
jgi:hypothetical protein